MRTYCLKNGLVVGVILLFIGIAIQPAIAVNPISTDNEDDCDICPKISNLHLVRLRSLINRVETPDNKLSVISKFHPKLAEKYQELFNRITTLKEINKELKPYIPWYEHPIICIILYSLLLPSFTILAIMQNIYERIESYSLLFFLLFPFYVITCISFFDLLVIADSLNCIDFDFSMV